MERKEIIPTGTATYCPEDDKLRLYVGRVPREEYEFLRSEGWTSTPKQGCDFVAVWTPQREDTAIQYSEGILEDEDMSPADRAADRAERFAGYRDKRTEEALDRAERYESSDKLIGCQSEALAERKARALERVADRAVNAWDKAEYWQRRTEGVISHALHVAAPGVRMGRIKTLEAELRREEKTQAEEAARWAAWEKVLTLADMPESSEAWNLAHNIANRSGFVGGYMHPEPDQVSEYVREHGTSLWSLLTNENGRRITGHEAARLYLGRWKRPDDPANRINRWINHYRLRIAYENQMLEAQGGRAGAVDMVPGGWIGERQIMKVNKSTTSGRVVSVAIKVPRIDGWQYKTENVPGTDYAVMTFEVERLTKEIYRAPTAEELEAFEAAKKADKKKRADATPKAPPLINPTIEDAERLQTIWNAQKVAHEPKKVLLITQEQYTAACKNYSKPETKEITGGGFRMNSHYNAVNFPAVAKVRACYGSVIVLTDKPQKPLTAEMWHDPRPALLSDVSARIDDVYRLSRQSWLDFDKMSEDEKNLFTNARLVGLAYYSSMSQYGLTEKGAAVFESRKAGVA